MASERFSSHQATGQIIIWTLWRFQLKERMEQERRKKDDCFWKLFGAGDYNISMLVSFWSFMLVFMVVSMSGPISKFPGSFHLSFHVGISVSLGLPVNCQCQLPSQISTSLYPRHFRVISPSPPSSYYPMSSPPAQFVHKFFDRNLDSRVLLRESIIPGSGATTGCLPYYLPPKIK